MWQPLPENTLSSINFANVKPEQAFSWNRLRAPCNGLRTSVLAVWVCVNSRFMNPVISKPLRETSNGPPGASSLGMGPLCLGCLWCGNTHHLNHTVLCVCIALCYVLRSDLFVCFLRKRSPEFGSSPRSLFSKYKAEFGRKSCLY